MHAHLSLLIIAAKAGTIDNNELQRLGKARNAHAALASLL